MNWFERITGFREGSYDATQRRLVVAGNRLVNELDGSSAAMGELELISLHALRDRVNGTAPSSTPSTISLVVGDVRRMHSAPEYAGAVFQVASQFNLLEMVSPEVSPERGVTGYEHDATQGPACAMAAGAATIFRNYLVPMAGGTGQTARRQLDGLAVLGRSLAAATGVPASRLWTMRNGYALCSESGLGHIDAHLRGPDESERDRLRGQLQIGICRDADVTDMPWRDRSQVTQALCSALPVAYGTVPALHWERFARLVLEAAYEATLCEAVLNARRGVSRTVLLTLLGGGAFGNDRRWIIDALRRALLQVADSGLDIRIVSYGLPPPDLTELAADFR